MTFPLRATGNILTTKSAPTLPDDDELPWMPLPKVLPVPPLPDVPPKVVTNQAPMALPSVGDNDISTWQDHMGEPSELRPSCVPKKLVFTFGRTQIRRHPGLG